MLEAESTEEKKGVKCHNPQDSKAILDDDDEEFVNLKIQWVAMTESNVTDIRDAK